MLHDSLHSTYKYRKKITAANYLLYKSSKDEKLKQMHCTPTMEIVVRVIGRNNILEKIAVSTILFLRRHAQMK
jgi:hypothetical protein